MKYYLWFLLLLFSCRYEFPEVQQDESTEIPGMTFEDLTFIGSWATSGLKNGVISNEEMNSALPELLFQNHEEWGLSRINYEYSNHVNLIHKHPLLPNVGRSSLFFDGPNTVFLQHHYSESTNSQSFSLSDQDNDKLKNWGVPALTVKSMIDQSLPLDYEQNQSVEYYEKLSNLSGEVLVLELGIFDVFNFIVNSKEENEGEWIESEFEIYLQEFTNDFNQVLSEFSSRFSNIIILNIPPFIDFPILQYSPIRFSQYTLESGVIQTARQEATFFNQEVLFHNQDAEVDQLRTTIEFGSDAPDLWFFVVKDNTLPDAQNSSGSQIPKVRQISADDKVLFPVNNVVGDNMYGFISNPLEKKHVYSNDEMQFYREFIEEVNQSLQASASVTENVIYIDNREFFRLFIEYNGVEPVRYNDFVNNGLSYSVSISETGIFSSDGFSLNDRGNALYYNFFVEKFNEIFDTRFKTVNPNSFGGNIIEY